MVVVMMTSVIDGIIGPNMDVELDPIGYYLVLVQIWLDCWSRPKPNPATPA